MTLSSAIPWTTSSVSRVLPSSGKPSLSHNRMMLRKLFQFGIICKGLPAMDSQLTRLHLHFASTKSSTFVQLASRQLKCLGLRRVTRPMPTTLSLFWDSTCTPSHAHNLVLGHSLNHVQRVQSFALIRRI
jgi:hypothetical protein